MSSLQSRISSPLEDSTLLQRSLLFAELSNIAYLDPDRVEPIVSAAGFDHIDYIERDGSQAYIFDNAWDSIIACRGTEPTEWNDIKADIDAVSVVAETIGRVHRGFKNEVDDLWPVLEQHLLENGKSLWFCGHSLGGAMAAICAGRCFLSHIPGVPSGVFTFGSPRVGNKRYVNHVKLDYFRWVNNNDIVTHVPPAWMRYRHTGQELYINAYGRVRDMTGWQRVKDRWRGFVMGLKEGSIDNFRDHQIDLYISAISGALDHHQAGDMDRKSERVVARHT